MKQDIIFYTFRDNSSYTSGFTWAASIRPRSELINSICSKCGTVEHYPIGAFDVVLEGGSKYPDALGSGTYPFLIVSEVVINTWQKAGITTFHTYPVGIAEVRSKSRQLHDTIAPHYYRVEIDGRCQIDLVSSGVEVIRICSECHRVTERPRYPFVHSYRMTPGSWDGSPLFRDPMIYPRVNFCTQEVLDLAGQQRFTNFRFEPMEEPPNPASKGIDYLKRARDKARPKLARQRNEKAFPIAAAMPAEVAIRELV